MSYPTALLAEPFRPDARLRDPQEAVSRMRASTSDDGLNELYVNIYGVQH